MPLHQVRSATIRDAKTIAEIELEAANQAMPGLLGGAEPAAALAQRMAFWRDAIEYSEPQVQLALEPDGAAGRIVGFVGFDRSRDKGTAPTMGEIWALYVLSSHWNTGAGLALWDAAREGLLEEGCTHVTVWLPMVNLRSLRFFELAGFKRELKTARVGMAAGVRLEEIRLKRALS